MVAALRFRFSQLPLRWRLTLWYLLTLTTILLLFAGFLYWQVGRTLLAQVDTGLQLAAAQALVNVDVENGRLAFRDVENSPQLGQLLSEDMGISLVGGDGTVWVHLGLEEEVPPQTPAPGLYTIRAGDDVWRVYGEAVSNVEHGVQGWLLVMQSLEVVNETLVGLGLQLLWGLPLALLLAGGGGIILARGALRPIENITHTAEVISGSDMSQRIDYEGPPDEVGRLAATFDRMLNRLQAAFERERRFTGDAAHELRTPLAALKGRIGVTLSRPRQADTYTATLHEMEGQVDRLIRLSSDLLFMARLDQGQEVPRMAAINAYDFLAAVTDQIRPLIGAKGIALDVAVPHSLTLHGDMDLLIRLFLNLLDNAVKFSPENGRMGVEAAENRGWVEISIHDNGAGIAPEHIPHLFERFYRVESDRARSESEDSQGGAGLGLAIAYEIARAHRGTLAVDSEPGRGTTFVVRLPQREDTIGPDRG